MCGRTSYTARALSTAATELSQDHNENEHEKGGNCKSPSSGVGDGDAPSKGQVTKQNTFASSRRIVLPTIDVIEDRQNTGPGHEFNIFRRQSNSRSRQQRPSSLNSNNDNDVDTECIPAIWGLLPNNGTHLLPTNPKFSVSPHYTMFNARSETLYDKRSFSRYV